MTAVLTDTELRVIESLDFELACDIMRDPCDAEPKWAITVHNTCCGEIAHKNACVPHLSAFLRWVERPAKNGWRCESCGFKTDDPGCPIVIDQIEPLR